MARLDERLVLAEKALNRFAEVVRIKDPSEIERDATIQRFEFAFEAVWKAAKDFLWENDGIDAASPKSVIRACRETGVMNAEETMQVLKMADERNLTVHTYNEKLAVLIHSHLPEYHQLLQNWFDKMKAGDCSKADEYIN